MSNYTPITDFSSKDSLSSGDPNKRALGTHVSAELSAIATAISTKADTASPTFSGTTTAAALTVTGTLKAQGAQHVIGSAVAPFPWTSTWTSVDIGPTGLAATGVNTADWFSAYNLYYDGTNWRYKANGAGTIIATGATGLSVVVAPAGVAGAVATLATPVVVSPTGDLTVAKTAPTLILNATGTNDDPGIKLQDGGVTRWSVFRYAPNGNLYLQRTDGAGAFLDNPLTIDATTGLVTVTGDPTAALGVATKQFVEASTGITVVSSTAFTPSVNMSGVASGSEVLSTNTTINVLAGDVVVLLADSASQVTATAGQFFHAGVAWTGGTGAIAHPVAVGASVASHDCRQITTGPDSLNRWVLASTMRVTSSGTLTFALRVRNDTGVDGVNTVSYNGTLTVLR